jgi:hypothetical protein
VQASTGTLQVGTDFNTGGSDTLVVDGRAVLNGSVKVLPSSILPIAAPVIIANGGVTGQLVGVPSTLYAYDVRQSAGVITVTPRATGFAPLGFGISGPGLEVANYLTSVFDHAAPGPLGNLFEDLGDLADAGGSGYAKALDQLAPGTMFAFASQRLTETQSFADGLFGCRDFAGNGAFLTAQGCAYMTANGRFTRQFSGDGYGRFTLNSASWQAGGQVEVAPGWLVGGAAGYNESWLTGTGSASGNSETGYVGASVVREIGPWQVGLATFGSFGTTKTTRLLDISEFAATLSASPDVESVGGRARIAYTAASGMFYIQPTLDLDLILVHSGAASEGGALAAQLQSASQTTFAATPMVEVGMRSDLSPTTVLHSFFSLGASVPSNDRWQQGVRFDTAPAAGSFAASLPMSGTSGIVKAGVDFVTAGQFGLQAAYDGAFSGRVVSNTFTLKANYQF